MLIEIKLCYLMLGTFLLNVHERFPAIKSFFVFASIGKLRAWQIDFQDVKKDCVLLDCFQNKSDNLIKNCLNIEFFQDKNSFAFRTVWKSIFLKHFILFVQVLVW